MESWTRFKLDDENLSEKQIFTVNVVEKVVEADNESWEKYFTIESNGVKYYETTIDKAKTHTLKLYVSDLNYGNFYAWNLLTDKFDNTSTHPFMNIDLTDIDFYKIDNKLYMCIGGINAKNEIMDCLFDTIIDNDKLEKSSGSIDYECYRSRLIKMLHDLWD